MIVWTEDQLNKLLQLTRIDTRSRFHRCLCIALISRVVSPPRSLEAPLSRSTSSCAWMSFLPVCETRTWSEVAPIRVSSAFSRTGDPDTCGVPWWREGTRSCGSCLLPGRGNAPEWSDPVYPRLRDSWNNESCVELQLCEIVIDDHAAMNVYLISAPTW